MLQCLTNIAKDNKAAREAKMELMATTHSLMPGGKPDLLGTRKYPTIKTLVADHGYKTMLAAITFLVRDFCESINVVRNMTEMQMIEAAGVLINEADNMRLEDYVLMFQMAKSGRLDNLQRIKGYDKNDKPLYEDVSVRIMDRLDMQIISRILDAFWLVRYRAGEEATTADYTHTESRIAENKLQRQDMVWDDKKGYVDEKKKGDMSAGFEALRQVLNNTKTPK